ncbi:MAG TPA: hypothetical protein VF995_05115 [Actinomycetota bacterium]
MRANVVLAAAIWTIYVWVTRTWNIISDPDPAHGFAFKAVHVLLALISIAFAVALGVIGLQLRREAGGRATR